LTARVRLGNLARETSCSGCDRLNLLSRAACGTGELGANWTTREPCEVPSEIRKESPVAGNRGRVFTTQNLTLLRQMAAQGYSAREIAEVIGSTPSSVRAKCSEQKIRLKRGRGRGRSQQLHAELLGEQVPIVAYLSGPAYAHLVQKAKELHQSPSVFVSKLLSAVVAGDLFESILED
jgi:hypothetical protein